MPLPRTSEVLASAALLVAVTSAAWSPRARDTSSDVERTTRVHAHFDSVLAELQSRGHDDLRSDQRARRTRLIGALRAYDARGEFPNNYDFPEQPTPYFVDRRTGVRCAVAHLLESTGRHDIVERVAATDNNVRVAELSGDTAFVGWLDAQGLTLAEAGRIQPSYEGSGGGASVSALAIITVVGGSVLTVGSSVGTSMWNATGNSDGHNQFGNVLGVVSGALTSILGAAILKEADGGAMLGAGVATAAVGGLSVALGLRGSGRRARASSGQREAPPSPTSDRDQRQASFVPIIGVGRNATAGLSVQIRF